MVVILKHLVLKLTLCNLFEDYVAILIGIFVLFRHHMYNLSHLNIDFAVVKLVMVAVLKTEGATKSSHTHETNTRFLNFFISFIMVILFLKTKT
jgi:hypothetical protein